MRHFIFAGLLFAAPVLATPVSIQNPIDTAIERGLPYTVLNNMTVPGPDAFGVSAKAYDQFHANNWSIWAQCSGTSVDVRLDWMESPTTESTEFGVGAMIVDHLLGNAPRNYRFDPVRIRYGMMKVTGNAGNGLDTVCTVKLYLGSPVDP